MDEGETDGEEEAEPKSEVVEISLHAITGTVASQIMRVPAKIKGCSLMALLDTGSSHNFLNRAWVSRIGMKAEEGARLSVMVANGEKLPCMGHLPGIPIEIQGNQFQVDFFVISLEGCDAVLGAQWLATLGSILWDFALLTVAFQWQGQLVTLGGVQPPASQAVDQRRMEKELRSNRGRGTLMCVLAETPPNGVEDFTEVKARHPRLA